MMHGPTNVKLGAIPLKSVFVGQLLLIIRTHLIVEGNLTYFDSFEMTLNIKFDVTAKPWVSIREASVSYLAWTIAYPG